jgi:hypothetical protein
VSLREPIGEDWVADPRERRLRVAAQLIDKPLYLVAVVFAFAAAARGPGMIAPGYEPSGWFVLGLWVLLCIALRLGILGFLAWFRARFDIPAPRREAQAGTESGE